MTTSTALMRGGSAGPVHSNKRFTETIEYTLDIADFIAEGLVTTDIVTAFTIPANTYVRPIFIYNTATSLGAGNRIDIGDSGSITQWVSNHTTQTAGAMSIATASEAYVTADVLNIKITGGTIASGTIRIVCEIVDLTHDTPMTVGTF